MAPPYLNRLHHTYQHQLTNFHILEQFYKLPHSTGHLQQPSCRLHTACDSVHVPHVSTIMPSHRWHPGSMAGTASMASTLLSMADQPRGGQTCASSARTAAGCALHAGHAGHAARWPCPRTNRKHPMLCWTAGASQTLHTHSIRSHAVGSACCAAQCTRARAHADHFSLQFPVFIYHT